jgi:putative endonuclease
MSKQRTGTQGERIAVEYLRRKDYAVIETNWRCTRGELDIIAREGDMLVFVEVRTRRAANTEAALVSITPRKRDRLIAAVHSYIAEHKLEDFDWRIDVVAVALPRSGQPLIDHVEDALGW